MTPEIAPFAIGILFLLFIDFLAAYLVWELSQDGDPR